MIDRRNFIAAASASALATAVPGLARAAAAPGAADATLDALLQQHVEAFLQRSPEEATGFNFDVGPHAALRGRLDDRSQAAIERDRQAVRAARRALAGIDRRQLGARAALDYDTARFVYDTLDDTLARYGYVDINLRPSPYVVSQMNGAYYWLPDFIGTRHPLADAADREAWLSRLSALAVALDQETARIRADAALGVVPPGFVIDRTLAQLTALRDGPLEASALVAPAVARARTQGLADLAGPATAIFRQSVAPALDRQIAALAALRPSAVETAGVWRLPDGDAYYASAVRANTTTDIPPAELHEIGLAQCAELTAGIDALLKARGLSRGSVVERMAALDDQPDLRVSDDEAGGRRLLALAEQQLRDVVARLPRMFGNTTVRPIEVRRIPPAVENGAPGAFYSEGAEGAPGVYSLNLKHPADHPLWRLPTLTHHEGVPGHHFQASVLGSVGRLPLFRKVVRFSAYTEGWALYAQQVADELGIFENDPVGRIGLLQSQLFRAARIVVDTGLHHKRWTRQQATAWMVEHAGERENVADREVVRYSVYPGQACSFKVGANRILAAREAARRRLGARFDVRAFHDLILESGPMPLAVLEATVDQWQRT